MCVTHPACMPIHHKILLVRKRTSDKNNPANNSAIQASKKAIVLLKFANAEDSRVNPLYQWIVWLGSKLGACRK